MRLIHYLEWQVFADRSSQECSSGSCPSRFSCKSPPSELLHQYRTRPGNDNFEFGWEMGRVARSIALGHGFSSPYEGNTGPTAWEPPLYPYLMAGVFKIFGIYSHASAWVLLSINSLFATFTTIPIFLIARKTFGERVASWSAYGWALNPYIWYWSIHWIWDTTFTPLVLSCIFLLALQLQDSPEWRDWIFFWRALRAWERSPDPTMLVFFRSAAYGSGANDIRADSPHWAASCFPPSSSLPSCHPGSCATSNVWTLRVSPR